MFEEDYNYLQRISWYSKRGWKEPLICTYLWDKYDLETQLLNRERLICRCDTDYAYDDDYNLYILNVFNTTSPFINQTLRVDSYAYNESGELEDGHLVLYIKTGDDVLYRLVGELPYISKVVVDEDFTVITKYYPSDVTEWAESIDPEEEPNISKTTMIHVRDYTEADYYVSKTGDDNNPGTITAPFKTLQHAMNVVPSGGTVCILSDLTYEDSVLCFTDCNIICKDENTPISTSNGRFLTIAPGTHLYLQGMNFKNNDALVYTYNDGHYLTNNEDALVTIETQAIKPTPTYKLGLTGDLYWISGETVNLKVTGEINGKTIYVLNSLNELITILNDASEFTYTVPYGLEYDIIRLFVLEDNYTYSKTFEIYDISSDWYVDTVNGDNNNTGKNLHDAFKNLEVAVAHVTSSSNHIFFIGGEIINNQPITSTVYIRGLRNKSVLYCGDTDYFNVSTGNLILSDLFLDDTLVSNNSYINNGSTPLMVHSLEDTVSTILYVDGDNGDDRRTGDSWQHALHTLQKALTKTAERIYYSGENTINTPLNIDETIEITGVMNDNQITSTTTAYFNIGTGKVLKLRNITLKNNTETGTITNNTYTNNSTAKLEVII